MAKESALSFERTQLIAAVEAVSGDPSRLKVEEENGALRVNLWVWDAANLEWVRMIQPQVAFQPLEMLLEELVTQIKVMNIQLAHLTGQEVSEEDV